MDWPRETRPRCPPRLAGSPRGPASGPGRRVPGHPHGGRGGPRGGRRPRPRRPRRPGLRLPGLSPAGRLAGGGRAVKRRLLPRLRPTGAARSPGFGPADAADRRRRPGAGRARRQPHRPGVHRRPQRRLALRRAAPGRSGQPADRDARRRRAASSSTSRVVAAVRCAPPANAPTPEERDTCCALAGPRARAAAPTAAGGRRASAAFGWPALLAGARRGRVRLPRPRPAFGHGAEVSWPARAGR